VLDDDATTLELSHERAEKLVPTTRGWRLEVVEESEVGVAAMRACSIELRAHTRCRRATHPARGSRDCASVHEATR